MVYLVTYGSLPLNYLPTLWRTQRPDPSVLRWLLLCSRSGTGSINKDITGPEEMVRMSVLSWEQVSAHCVFRDPVGLGQLEAIG